MGLPLTPPAQFADALTVEQAMLAAAALLDSADALLIGAGAGMSAESGLPTYYGTNGRYSDQDLTSASAATFSEAPLPAAQMARDRLAQLTAAAPHSGYLELSARAEAMPYGAAVITSNIDGLFVRAGFTNPAHTPVYEVHGNASWSQCLDGCPSSGVFPTPEPAVGVAVCPDCGSLARPNVMMFADYAFNDTRRAAQWTVLGEWFDRLPASARVVVLELGVGTTVQTVRRKCETFAHTYGWPLVRINPTELDCLTPTPPATFLPIRGTCQEVLGTIC